MKILVAILLIILCNSCSYPIPVTEVNKNTKNLEYFAPTTREEPYTVLLDGERIVRLNKQSGEILEIRDDGIRRYDESYVIDIYTKQSSMGQLKRDNNELPETNGLMYADISYKWRNNKILYSINLGPYHEELEKVRVNSASTLYLQALDADGFAIKDVAVLFSGLTRIQNDKSTVVEWQQSGEIECVKDDYLLVDSWSLKWFYEDDFQVALHSTKNKLLENKKELVSWINEGRLPSIPNMSLPGQFITTDSNEIIWSMQGGTFHSISGNTLWQLYKATSLYNVNTFDANAVSNEVNVDITTEMINAVLSLYSLAKVPE